MDNKLTGNSYNSALGHAAHLRYYAHGLVTSKTDAVGAETNFGYNIAGQGESVTLPATGQTGPARGKVEMDYLYPDGPLTNATLYDESDAQFRPVTYGYGPEGETLSVTGSTEPVSYTCSYGDLNELKGVTTSYTGAAPQTVSYDYYPDGSRQNMTTSAGGFSYFYDAAGRLSSLSNPYGQATNWTYYDDGRLHTQQLANGAVTTYSYDALGRLTRLLNEGFAAAPTGEWGEPPAGNHFTLSDFMNFTYDGAGNRLSYTASVPGSPSASGTLSYEYDAKDQLKREQSTRGAGYTRVYDYDAAGNPAQFAGTSKTYNANNQQTGTGFTHGGNGNPTAYKGAALSFDPENRLTSYAEQMTAGYRGDGLRAWKQNPRGARLLRLRRGAPRH